MIRCPPHGMGAILLYGFENFVLDTSRRELRGGEVLVRVEPQVFDLLEYLIVHRDRVVTRDDLFDSIWKGRIVSDATLSSRISAARSAIGDTGERQQLIRTLPGRGFASSGRFERSRARPARRPRPRRTRGRRARAGRSRRSSPPTSRAIRGWPGPTRTGPWRGSGPCGVTSSTRPYRCTGAGS